MTRDAGTMILVGTRKVQFRELSSRINSLLLPPKIRLAAMSPAPFRAESIGSSKTNHQSMSSPISSAEPRSRKRVGALSWGIGGWSLGNRSRSENVIYPVPEHDCGIQNDEALPEIGMGEIKPQQAVLAEIEEGNKAEQVHELNNGCAA